MEARLLKTLIFISAIILTIQTADAINLGTLQKSSAANISDGETAVFRTLFWSTDEEDYAVSIQTLEAPKEWIVMALPEQFVLGKTISGKSERIYLPGAKNTLDAKVVDIYITAPKKTTTGSYNISINAIAGNTNGNGFSLLQERKIRFIVNVLGAPPKPAQIENNADKTVLIDISQTSYDMSSEAKQIAAEQYAEQLQKETEKKTVSWVVIAIISIIAWRLYKHD